jgi:hypothetical protein
MGGDVEELVRRMRSLDRNDDGRVSRPEFQGPDAVFARLDVDRNGVLDETDFQAMRANAADGGEAGTSTPADPTPFPAPTGTVPPRRGQFPPPTGELPPPQVIVLTPGRQPETPAPGGDALPWSEIETLPPTDGPRVPQLRRNDPAQRFAMPTRTQILDIRKTHNLPKAPHGLALRLDFDVAVVGKQGQEVSGRVLFLDTRTGRPLRATHRAWADAQGNVTAFTRRVRMQTDRRIFQGSLWIPYRAFPHPPGVDSYGVEARVEVLLWEDRDTSQVVARDVTTFTVSAGPAAPAPDATSPVETGTPGR